MKNEENNNIDEDKNEIIKDKINFFLKEQIRAHLDLQDRSWLNGTFLKKFEGDMYLFVDDVLGEQHLALAEIKNVSTFRSPKKDGVPFKANNF